MSLDFSPGVFLSIYGDIVPDGPRLVLSTRVTYPRKIGELFLFRFPFTMPSVRPTAQNVQYYYKDILARITRAEEMRRYPTNQALTLRSETLRASGYGPDGTTVPEWGDFIRILMPAPFSPEPFVPQQAGPNAIPYESDTMRVMGQELDDDSLQRIYSGNFFRRSRAPREWERGYQRIDQVSFVGDKFGFPGGYSVVSLIDLRESAQVPQWVADNQKMALLGTVAIGALGSGFAAKMHANTPWRLTTSTQPELGTTFHDGMEPGFLELYPPDEDGFPVEVRGVHGTANGGEGADRFSINLDLTRSDGVTIPGGEFFELSDKNNLRTLRLTSGGGIQGDYTIIDVDDQIGATGKYQTAVLDVPSPDSGACDTIVASNQINNLSGTIGNISVGNTITVTSGADAGSYRVIAVGVSTVYVEELNGIATSFATGSVGQTYIVHDGGLDQNVPSVSWEVLAADGEVLEELLVNPESTLTVCRYISDAEVWVNGFVPLSPWRGELRAIWVARAWVQTNPTYNQLSEIDATRKNVIELENDRTKTMFFRESMLARSIFVEGPDSEVGDPAPLSDSANGRYRFSGFQGEASGVDYSGAEGTIQDTNLYEYTSQTENFQQSDIGTKLTILGTEYYIADFLFLGGHGQVAFMTNLDGSLPSFSSTGATPSAHTVEDRYYEATLEVDFSQKVINNLGDPDVLTDVPWRFIPTVPVEWTIHAPLFDWNARAIPTSLGGLEDGNPNLIPIDPDTEAHLLQEVPIIEGNYYAVDFQIDVESFSEEDFTNTGRFRIVAPPNGQLLPGTFRDAHAIICRGDPNAPQIVYAYPVNYDDPAWQNNAYSQGTLGQIGLSGSVYVFTKDNGTQPDFVAGMEDDFILQIRTEGPAKGIFTIDNIDLLTLNGETLNLSGQIWTELEWALFPVTDPVSGIISQSVRCSDLRCVRQPEPTAPGYVGDTYFRQDFYIDIFPSVEEAINAREAIKREISALMTSFGGELSEFVVVQVEAYGQVGEGLQEAFFTP